MFENEPILREMHNLSILISIVALYKDTAQGRICDTDLATLPDAKIITVGFSREEIFEGLTKVSKI